MLLRRLVRSFATFTAPDTAVVCASTAWSAVGIDNTYRLQDALSEMGIASPTPVQELAIPAVLSDGATATLFIGQTGSGKSLAFLLPLIQRLKHDEVQHGVATRPNRPRALVLCPSRELARQTMVVAKKLSHSAKFSGACITSGCPRVRHVEAMSGRLDLVVATPGRLLRYFKQGDIKLSDVRYLVLDEADTMLCDNFAEDVFALIDPIKARDDVSVVLAAATASSALLRIAKSRFSAIQVVQTEDSHRPPPGLEAKFVAVSGAPNAKHEAIMRCFSKSRIVRTMVFCNTVASCRSLGHYLQEQGVPNACLHGDIPQARRADEYRQFVSREVNVLVCTDAAARGLDVEGVAHVILFDFPHDATEYLHRVGRTARAGTRGRVTALVCKRDLTLARELRDATRQHVPLMSLERPTQSAPRHRGHHEAPARSPSRFRSHVGQRHQRR